jgi:RNA polymerase sigma factor (sigma-70 family)
MRQAPPEVVAFIRREQPRLVRAADLLVGDRAVAEEIAQEALLRALSRWEHVGGLASPGGWTHRVAVNLATSQLRRRAVERRARGRLARGEVSPTPDSDTALAVRAALAALPTTHRRVLVLRHVLDWSTAEIADLDQVSEDAVRQRLHRARHALREQLGRDHTLEEHHDVHGDRRPAGRGLGGSHPDA